MKVLQASEQYLISCGLIIPDARCWSLLKTSLLNFFFVFFMGIFLCGSSSAYVCFNFHDIGGSANAIMVTVGSFMCTNKYLSLRSNTRDLKMLIASFQKFIDQVPTSKHHFYEKAEQKGRSLTYLLMKIMLATGSLTLGILPLFNSFYKIYTGNLDTRRWIEVFQLKIPFYQHSITEYYIRLCAIVIVAVIYQLVIMVPVTFFISCCFLIEAGYQHFISLCEENQVRKSTSKDIKIGLINAILLHKELIRLTGSLQQLMSGPLFFQLSCYAIHTAACLMMVENELDNIGIPMIEAIFCMFASGFWVFIYSFYATHASIIQSMFGTVVFESKWYDYPLELRSYLILMIRRSQQPFNFNGYKLIRCDLETFAKIFRLVLSYYVMLRKFRE